MFQHYLPTSVITSHGISSNSCYNKCDSAPVDAIAIITKEVNNMVTHNMNNSLATLCNIGNSCYMNSVLYTLRFAPNFTHNLHHLVEFLELVLHKSNAEKKCLVEHNQYQQNHVAVQSTKPKSSSLGRNISGLHGASGHSWSNKDLISLESNSANGYDTSANHTTVVSSGGGSGVLSDINTSDKSAASKHHAAVLNGNAIGTAYSNCSANIANNVRESETNVTGSGIKSNRQLVCEILHELFHNLARNETSDIIEPFHAGGLLQAVQNVSTTFEGNQQQDAHEFLMCLLDSVRESCHTLNEILLENPEVLKNSSLSNIGPTAVATAPIADFSMDTTSITTAAEPKSSGTQFIGRNIFRRRKESQKNTKALLAKESSTVATMATDNLANVKTATGNNFIESLSSSKETAPTATVTLSNGGTTSFQKPSAADEQLKERIRTLGLNFFADDFEGVTVSRTRCLSCETVTEQKETMIDIAIPITSNEISDAAKNPQQFYQDACITQEYFRTDNKYRCEVCSRYTEACRTISFDILPRLLVLQLKRFNGDMEKINTYIPTPFVLQCFCRECFGKADSEKRHIYRLYSVITHVGARMSVGHYIAYTSALDIPLQYINCVKDRQRKQVLLDTTTSLADSLSNAEGVCSNGSVCTKNQSVVSEKSASGQLKKLFGGKKASSAGDVSKKLKNNVINRFSPSNGIEALHLYENSVIPVDKPTIRAGSNDNLYSIHHNNIIPNLLHHHVAGDFPINGISGAGNGGKSLNLMNDSSCQSVGCCAVMSAKQSVANNRLPPNDCGSNNSGDVLLLSENSRKNSSHNLSSMSSSGSMLAASCGANCTTNHHNFNSSSIVNGDNARSGVLTATSCQSSTCSTKSMLDRVAAGGNSELSAGNNTTRGGLPACQQQLMWYMCDDDKIKIMTQLEFEEILSPNRRHVITPYLLFYARYDVQQKQESELEQEQESHNQHNHQQPQSPSLQQQNYHPQHQQHYNLSLNKFENIAYKSEADIKVLNVNA
ncbi:uncharacterized protein LOC128728375 [Anopheles nili]|uniref:uncharacterized protein LOC128728375 n=1 Tax=Anopheles nili TaxID=185578 RepID=UPI00237C2CAC|nr:uncharacterized protein LOC128728375 [Anopheles nili]